MNGVRLSTLAGGVKECLAVFFSSFAAFNLLHVRSYESMLELMEHDLGFRVRVTKKAAKTMIS